MEKEPIYRVKVEVIGEEPEGFKIDETLRGGRLQRLYAHCGSGGRLYDSLTSRYDLGFSRLTCQQRRTYARGEACAVYAWR